MKKMLLAVPLILLLSACGPQITTKTTGEITDKNGCAYFHITYKMPDGKYGVNDFPVETYQQCGMYSVGEKVTVFYNDNGVVEISK